jgi:DNA-binding CsgD family transcriptional regulator
VPQSRAGTSKQALARIQRLCCLGVGSEMLMPDLMREVTALTAAQHGAFYWFTAKRRVANVYCTLPASVLALYLNEFEGTGHEYEVFWGPNQRETPPPVRDPVVHFDRILRVDHRTFLRSDFYNVIWRPADIYEFLRLRIPAPEPAPWLCIYRGEQEARFEPRDADMLASIAGFVAHGMARGPSDEGALADTDDRALFIVDRGGALRHASVEAQHLLIMALHPCRCANAIRGLGDRSLEISRLCLTLAATATGSIGQSPPVLRLRNPWGEFMLRAYWLGATDGTEQTRQIGITIERRVPRVLAVRRRVENLPLTGREKQLCLLLAHARSRQDLADAMGVSTGTVITHQSNLYAKLGMHSRAGLLAALLSE